MDITTICNLALAAVGTRSSISSLSEASNEARACALHYDTTRRHLLRAAHWGFARDYTLPPVMLSHRSTPEFWAHHIPLVSPWDRRFEPSPPWLYAYYIMQEEVAVRYVLPSAATGGEISPPFFGTQSHSFEPSTWMGPSVKFETGVAQIFDYNWVYVGAAACLLTNMPKAVICFTRNIVDTNLFDDSFTRALIQALAANISTTLTGDLKLFDALIKTANSLILEARVKSANEGLNAIDVMPDWYRVRGLGPAVGSGPWIAEYGPLFGGVM